MYINSPRQKKRFMYMNSLDDCSTCHWFQKLLQHVASSSHSQQPDALTQTAVEASAFVPSSPCIKIKFIKDETHS